MFYQIKSEVLRNEGHKLQTVDRKYAMQRLAEIQVRDPKATLLKMPVSR